MENSFYYKCEEEGKRLDVFLAEKLSVTRTKIKEMIEKGHIRISGKAPKPSSKIKRYMEIEGEIPPEPPSDLIAQDIPIRILYEDEYILAVDKEKDMVVHPSFGHRQGTLVNAILSYLKKGSEAWGISSGVRPGVVHRLDKGTTGVILIAKDPKTQEMLSSAFKDRSVQKTYLAVVEGEVKEAKGLIEGNIGRHPIHRKKMAVLKDAGREALTGFKVLKRLKGFTFIEVYPKTGRTHQIRVHLAHKGHPVAGDDLYGKKAKYLIDRPLLHAHRIVFMHPVKGVALSIEALPPDDMKEFIKQYEI